MNRTQKVFYAPVERQKSDSDMNPEILVHPDFELFFGFPPARFFCDGIAFIIQFFTFCQRDVNFYPAAGKIYPERHDRVPLPGNGGFQFIDFTLMKQQLPPPNRVLIKYVPMLVGADVHPFDERALLFDDHLAFL